MKLLKIKEIQTDVRIEPPIYGAAQNCNHHFAGGADDGTVQVATEHLTLLVAALMCRWL